MNWEGHGWKQLVYFNPSELSNTGPTNHVTIPHNQNVSNTAKFGCALCD